MSAVSVPRVRFAPSPTGSLHVGGARTALYNLLFARRTKGVFLLRVEDTDVGRSREELSDQILSALRWLQIDWDEGPYFQSQRLELYSAAAAKLIAQGKAYRAFETPEVLAAERQKAEAAGRAYRYSGAGRAIPPEESERRAKAGERHVVRLAMPAETIVVEDIIRGRVEFPADALDDFALVRSDGHPLYHFCVCVDDVDMAITHVIRGDDHLANTPKHVALFRALGAPPPQFAHLGMILGTDRKKLSKRHGAAAVEEWRDAGILPEALFNFLALLGWAPGGDREILTRAEMEDEFTLEKVGASPSVFDPEKLLWMNAQYMAQMPAEELLKRAKSWPSPVPSPSPSQAAQTQAQMAAIWAQQLTGEVAAQVIELHRRRARTIVEMSSALSTYGTDPTEYDPDSIKKHVTPETPDLLGKLIERLETLSDWTSDSLERTLRTIAEESGVPAAKLIHPTRLALTGTTVGAPLFDVAALLGKEKALRRLKKFLDEIAPHTPA